MGRFSGLHNAGKGDGDLDSVSKPTDDGLPKGRKERFLVNSTGLELIKQAAIGLDKTASEVTEEAANDWRELQRAGDREL
ncbi:hypothetical protein WN73_37835 [Bradyrhizobium sp. CCBAU 45394]|nr:hypothetical protein [Bradyrhizobium sp. CCBAU 45394]